MVLPSRRELFRQRIVWFMHLVRRGVTELSTTVRGRGVISCVTPRRMSMGPKVRSISTTAVLVIEPCVPKYYRARQSTQDVCA